MTTNATQKAQVQQQFGATAAAYVTSRGHASGDDLAQLAAWAAPVGGPDRRALDIATGGGHTALAVAPHFGQVIASDLTPPMLATAAAFIRQQGADNVTFAAADAERLPFASASFDLVTCRIAPHHFTAVAAFVNEVARVLRPGGSFLLEDSIVSDDPEVAAYLNRIEWVRDHSHNRSLSLSEWHQLCTAAGLTITAEAIFPKTHPHADWVARSRTTPADRAELARLFREAPSGVRAAFQIAIAPTGEILSHTDEKVLLCAVRAGSS